MSSKRIYLAISFTGMEELSFQCANEVASLLIKEGHFVFSPISHSYPIWKTEMVDHTYEIWMRQDEEFFNWCEELYVITVEGYEDYLIKSKGVKMEMNWAYCTDKPVKQLFYNPETKILKQEEEAV